MSIRLSKQSASAVELDMRNLLRTTKKAEDPVASKEPEKELASLVSHISGRSVYEIENLMQGLQSVLEKLNSDGDRLHRQIESHVAYGHSIKQLTEIISDEIAQLDVPVPAE